MPIEVQEIYRQIVAPLSPTERLQLATLILNSLQNALVIDESDTWTEQDQQELVAFSLQYATSAFPEEDEDIIE